MNVLSLFDGMSCGQIALDKLGITPKNYFAAEIDKHAIKVAKANYPDMVHLGDVRDIQTSGDHLIDAFDCGYKIDLLIGGSPCQGFSFAGKQLNFEDPRSILFFEYVRLLKALKPKYFLLENVRMKKESQDIITEYLGVEPIEINSNLVSAQNRRRLYWTNIPFEGLPEDKGIVLADILEDGFTDRDKSYCLDASYYKGGGASNVRLYFEKSRRQIVFGSGTNKLEQPRDEGLTWRKLSPVECERLQTVPDGYTEHVSNTQRYKMLGNGWTVDVIKHLFKPLAKEYS